MKRVAKDGGLQISSFDFRDGHREAEVDRKIQVKSAKLLGEIESVLWFD